MAGAAPSAPGDVGDDVVVAGSLVRLGGTAMAAVIGACTGAATARALGPADKGSLATVSLLVALAAVVASMGLADALVVRARASAAVVRASTPSLFTRVALIALPCGLGAAAIAASVADDALSSMTLAVAAIAVAPMAVVHTARRLSDGTGRHAVTAATQMTLAGTSAVVTIVAVNIMGGGLTAALGATIVGGASALVVHALATGRRAVEPSRPVAVRLRDGTPFMLVDFVRTVSVRIDLLVVYLLAGPRAAGLYSVALTIGDVALYPASSLAATVFGHAAQDRTDERAVARTMGRLARAAMLIALVLTALAAIGLPVVLPPVFGDAFTGAVGPAIVLVLGTAPASAQWVVSRIASARGAPGLAMPSLLAGVGVTVALDLAQASSLTPLRAAAASAIGSAVSLAVLVRGVRRRVAPLEWKAVIPRPGDVAAMVRAVAGGEQRA